jgi:hypothetical protein
MSGPPKFDFYEEVRILSGDPKVARLVGQVGVVLGRTETEDRQTWCYAVQLTNERAGYCFFESELETTGNHFLREDFYDGTSVRVLVDNRGRGTIVPPSEESDS